MMRYLSNSRVYMDSSPEKCPGPCWPGISYVGRNPVFHSDNFGCYTIQIKIYPPFYPRSQASTPSEYSAPSTGTSPINGSSLPLSETATILTVHRSVPHPSQSCVPVYPNTYCLLSTDLTLVSISQADYLNIGVYIVPSYLGR